MPTVREPSLVTRDINQNTNTTSGADAIVADVSLSADVRRYVAAAGAHGPIDAVVHAAGITGPAAPMPDFDEADFDRVMAVNARGAFLGMKHALAPMADRGAIVNIASVSGIAGYPMVAAYVASKHAVIGLTRTAALKAHQRASGSTRCDRDQSKAA
jgi:NAD(P)-dependent dehydrogenase (short-subunit alcohol dehydrogenase family)